MLYRLIFSLGVFALGYYLGREVGRSEMIRERMRDIRQAGGSVNLRDAVTIEMEKDASEDTSQVTRH